jgi:hypothetical protein
VILYELTSMNDAVIALSTSLADCHAVHPTGWLALLAFNAHLKELRVMQNGLVPFL